jgi:hypothetical protein
MRQFMAPDDRLLFLKYALPCAGTLVRRGKVSQEYINGLVELVSMGELPQEDAESMFKVANAMCDAVAEKTGKSRVDSDVIREYFLLGHSEVVDERYDLMRDFDPVECKTYKGEIVSLGNGSAMVRTRLGEKEYRTSFAKDVKIGDTVVVHWNFVIERPPAAFSKRMADIA